MKRTRHTDRPGRLKPTALERLDARFAADDHGSNAEIIRLLRAGMFADVDELEASGAVILPEQDQPPPQSVAAPPLNP